MSQQLENKNIVVIGGSTGIGLSAAKAFIAKGQKLLLLEETKRVLLLQKIF
jgi:NAD(P)-dependent dehydrogenase (short-subunit alcohol dehydrogenase family)